MGKNCIIHTGDRVARAYTTTFGRRNDCAYVEIAYRMMGTRTRQVTFAPPGGMTFDAFWTGEFVLLYNEKDKTWSGTLGGNVPATLTCSP
jgi:hypothetical protein